MRRFILFLITLVSVLPSVRAQDPVKTASADTTADPDNKRVNVTRFSVAPGQDISLPILSNESLVISLHGDSLTRTPLNGPSEKWAGKPGTVIWNRSATAYTISNTGETPAEFLVIELKDSYAIAQLRVPWSERDPVSLDPQHFHVALENEHVRVLQMRLNSREGSMESQFPDRLEVTLGDTHLTDTDVDGKTEEVTPTAGSVTWEKAKMLSSVNLGERPLENLIVELRHPFCYETPDTINENPSASPAMKAYVSRVRETVNKKWMKNMPRSVRDSEKKGLVLLQFKIEPQGTIPEDGVRFRTVFAADSLMEKALQAVRDAGPFSPFPPDFQKPFISFRFSFRYNLPPHPPGCQ